MHVFMHAYLIFLKHEELPNANALVSKQQANICESTCLEENACAAKSSKDFLAKPFGYIRFRQELCAFEGS